jgi:hypothetical protein
VPPALFIGSATDSTINGGAATVGVSGIGGIATGDFLLIFGGGFDRTSGSMTTNGTGPAIVEVANFLSGTYRFRVGWRFFTNDTTITFAGSGNTADAMAGCVMAFRFIDITTPLDGVAVTTGTLSSTNPNPPSIVPGTAPGTVVAMAGNAVNDASIGPITSPPGYLPATPVNITGSDTNSSSVAGQYIMGQPAGVVEDPGNFTTWSTGTWAAATVTLRSVADTFSSGGETELVRF